MEVRILRGENQIGGSIIEIVAGTTKIILDVGLELDNEMNKQLPDIPGLFEHAGYDAVFVTHYHGDHVGLAYRLAVGIPLYIGEASYRILKASDAYIGHPSIAVTGFLQHKVPIRVGGITVTPFLCDHSAFDSYMLICEADGERILYTGDFRANGRKSFERLLAVLPTEVDILVCEGTTLSREGYVPVTEQKLEKDAVELFRNTTGPVFVLQSSMNIDRIVTMYRAAKRSGRIFLQEFYMADIATAAGERIPNPAFGDVFAFITDPERYTGLCKYPHRMGKDTIAKQGFVMCVRNTMTHYLQSLSEKMDFTGGLLVYSFWSGYRSTDRMKTFLSECEKFGLRVVTLHTSGHADTKTIETLIRRVHPKRIMPVHTENAAWFDAMK